MVFGLWLEKIMKNKKRIKKILNQIENLWEELPDCRLMQLIINTFMLDKTVKDLSQLYYLEDSQLSQGLKDFYLGYEKETKKKKNINK